MLYSHCYQLSHKNISQINKTDQSVLYFATPEISLEAKASGNCKAISTSVSSYYSSICLYKIILLLEEIDKILSQV